MNALQKRLAQNASIEAFVENAQIRDLKVGWQNLATAPEGMPEDQKARYEAFHNGSITR